MGLSDDHLREIGRVTVNFNLLEAALYLVLKALSGVGDDDDVIETLTAGDPFVRRMEKAERLLPRVPDERLRQDLREWLKAARAVNQYRVEVVHSYWWPAETMGEAIRARITGKGAFRGDLVSVEKLSNAAKAIRDLGQQGVNLRQRLEQDKEGEEWKSQRST